MNKRIKCLVMDVDGTLTDGKIYMGANGEIMKAFSIKDGYGIHDILLPNGIIPIIITGRCSEIVERRCKELGISEIHQGIKDKENVLISCCNQLDVTLQECAYIGDDLNDLSCMSLIHTAGGLIGCPADAVDKIRKSVDFQSRFPGGNGAVREFIEWILSTKEIKS